LVTLSLYAKKSYSSITKNQIRVLNITTVIPFLAALYFEFLMPKLRLPGWDSPLTDISNIYISIWGFGFFYAIVKHNLFVVTPAAAADNIIAKMSEGLLLLNDELGVFYANEAAVGMLGFNHNELSGRNFVSILERKQDINPILRETLKKQPLSAYEVSLLRKSGRHFPALISFFQLKEGTELKGFACIITDITERKLAENKIKRERDRAQMYLDIAEVVFLVMDMDMNTVLINKKGREILGLPEPEILGKNWRDSFIPDGEKHVLDKVYTDIKKGLNLRGTAENNIKTAEGRKRLMRWSYTVVRNEVGDITGVLAAGTDITEQAEAQEKLRQSYEQLKELDN
ncbi:MAG TPA: PAS domain-containing protein, partial [Candidatus Goldiibacteriota bacterium]|nr:PAS domain-containing protein [Candidatus Goldiibacteriota bacterium]